MIPDYKRSQEQEYVIHLFDHCNLRCSFCWQGHVEKPDEGTISSKLAVLETALKREPARALVINIMGGELFSDDVFTEVMSDQYKQMITSIKNLSIKYDKDIAVNFLTNLVTSKLIEIDALLDHGKSIDLDVTLGISYDSKGRFNRKQKEIFKQNFEVFQENISGISIVMSIQNIESIMSRRDSYFDFLYRSGVPIYTDNYMPDKEVCDVPDDSLLLAFHKFAIDNYPNLSPFKQWTDRSGRVATITCRTTKMILSDNTESLCGGLIERSRRTTLFKDTLETNSNEAIEDRFLSEKGCLSCQYFQRCTLSCFMQHNYTNRRVNSECIQYKTFEYIDSRRS
jgi:sulfatase maturation enzyme AslB (radical SAM superfamily)